MYIVFDKFRMHIIMLRITIKIIQFIAKDDGERNGNPLQYSCLENPVARGAGGLLSIGSHRVRYD